MVNTFKDFFWKYVLIENYQAFSKNLTSFLILNSVSFYRNYCEKQKRPKNYLPVSFQLVKYVQKYFLFNYALAGQNSKKFLSCF